MFQRFFRQRNDLEWRLTPKLYPRESKENHSGKILLPQICLATLVQKQVETPYIFKISAHDGISYTHAGVHEFTEDIQDAVFPEWMFEQLALSNSIVEISCTQLPKGRFIKLLPQSKDFLEIDNPKSALERALRNYQVLSLGDTISLYFEDEFKSIMFTVSEIQPSGEGISIIDTDLEVDFLPPTDYEAKTVPNTDSLIIKTEKYIYIRDPYKKRAEGLGALFLPPSSAQ